MRKTLCFGFLCVAFAWSFNAHALEPAYLDEMPGTSRVLADMQGKDQSDTFARQAGAMSHLLEIVTDMAGQRYYAQKLTEDENRIYQAYMAEYDRITSAVRSASNPSTADGGRNAIQWGDQFGQYRNSGQFRAEILQRYFSAEFIAQYQQRSAEIAAQVRSGYQPPSEPTQGLFGRWNTMRPDQQVFTIQLGLGMFIVLMLVLAAEYLPFDIHPRDPHIIRAGLRRFRIEWVNGVLTNYRADQDSESTSKWMNTDLHGNHPGQRLGKWVTSSTSYLYEKFSLVNADTSQDFTVVQTASMSIDKGMGYFRDRVDREISAAWVTGRKNKFVGYLLFYDWVSADPVAEGQGKRTIQHLRPGKAWCGIPALLLGLAVAMPSLIPLARLWGPILVWIVWKALFGFVRGWRNRRFEAQVIPRLLEHLKV